MKITVHNEAYEPFEEVLIGGRFMYQGNLYMKVDGESARNISNGIRVTFPEIDRNVTPVYITEVHVEVSR